MHRGRLVQDFRIAWRHLSAKPEHSITAALTLALGIGLTTAMFSVANAVLIRPLPLYEQGRVVVLWGRSADGRFDNVPISLPEARNFAAATHTLASTAFIEYEGAWPKPLRQGDRVWRLRVGLVSGNFFSVLGAPAILGRSLQPSDDRIGAAPAIVLSYDVWQREFDRSSNVLGQQLTSPESGVAYTIVGVMSQGLDYPKGVDVWAPVVPAMIKPGTDSSLAALDVVGRLRAGIRFGAARDDFGAFLHRSDAAEGEPSLSPIAHSLPSLITGNVRPALLLFSIAAGLLLVLACVNVANLLLIQGLARAQEMAVRAALGASAYRIVGQLMTEAIVLAATGALGGLLISFIAVQAFISIAPPELPRLSEIRVDGVAVGAGVLISALTVLLFGLAPAIVATRTRLQDVFRGSARATTGSRGLRRLTHGLVVLQVALAVVVLSGAGLVARSLVALQRVDFAFNPQHLLIAQLAIPYQKYDSREKLLRLANELVPAVTAIRGVQAASPVLVEPFSGSGGFDGILRTEEQSPEAARSNPYLNLEVVAPAYFATLDLPIIRGRGLTEQDREGGPPVVVISEAVARHFWPTSDAIGKRFAWGLSARALTVVGIVPDTRYRDLREPRPTMYFPLGQAPFAPTSLAIRTRGSPTAIVTSLRRVVQAIDPAIAVSRADSFDDLLTVPLAGPRFNTVLLSTFAAAAMILAAIGLYGVVAASVAQRVRELGIRMALGAAAADIRGMVVRKGMALAVGGSAFGLLGALLATRFLAGLLFGVSPGDPLTLGFVTLMLLIVAGVASYLPARRATRIDPAIALRVDV